MKENSRILIKLLSKAIRNQEPDWDEITAYLKHPRVVGRLFIRKLLPSGTYSDLSHGF